ncbi:MAG: hypothetical protein ACLUSP_02705 [Christensenellales bacterium]
MRNGYRDRNSVYSVSSGKADLNVKVKLNGTVVAENVDSFFPEKAGTYSIEYVVTDYLGRTATASYNVTVEKERLLYSSARPFFRVTSYRQRIHASSV